MVNKILMTGATGYIANQLLPTFRENYEMVLVDVNGVNRNGDRVEGVEIADLIDPDRSKYAHLFKGVDAVVHLGYKRRTADNPLDHFAEEKQNVEMAYNVLRSAYDAGVPRVVIASSNHASDWYEHALIHRRQMEALDPYKLPLSDNFYGWAKATYEHMGFLFACGGMGFGSSSGGEDHTGGSQSDQRRMGVVMVRIGAPRDIVLGKERPAEHELGRGQRQLDLVELGAPDLFEQVADIGDDLIGRNHHLGVVKQRFGQRLQKFELPEIKRCRHRPAPGLRTPQNAGF